MGEHRQGADAERIAESATGYFLSEIVYIWVCKVAP